MFDLIPFCPNNHSNSTINYIQITNEEFNFFSTIVRRYYRIQPDGIVRVGTGINSPSYRVSYGGGFLLVQRPSAEVSFEMLQIEHDILRHCRKAGVRVPLPVPTISGDIVAEVGQEIFVAYRYAAGSHYGGSHPQLLAAAREVGALDLALRSAPHSHDVSRLFRKVVAPYSWEIFQEFIRLAPSHSAFWRRLRKYEPHIIANMEKLEAYQIIFQHGDQIIHGDLHPHNFIFDQDRLSLIIDFKEMRHGIALEDLSYALHRLIRQRVVALSLRNADTIRRLIKNEERVFVDNYLKNFRGTLRLDLLSPMIKHIAMKKIFTLLNIAKQDTSECDGLVTELEKHLISLEEANWFGIGVMEDSYLNG